jgi:hypothetical protein
VKIVSVGFLCGILLGLGALLTWVGYTMLRDDEKREDDEEP